MKQRENRSYHHGDLRRALLDAALQLVAERGLHDFTLREVARQAGVSHNAPYHHFADKAELVAALTIEGFQALEQALRSTYEQTEGTVLEKTLALSKTYIHFALDNRAMFSLMFRPELRQATHYAKESAEAVKNAADAAFQVVLDGITVSQQVGKIRTGPSTDTLAMSLWSTVHGLTMILLDDLLMDKKAEYLREHTDEFIAEIIDIVIYGLVVP